jgi:MYXO-CTERM domain-containing protein
MKISLVLALVAASAGVSQAATVLTLNPPSGDITGVPGETVGWGFDLSSDPTDWTTITAVTPIFETNPGLGSFLDFFSPQGGPVNGSLAPGAPDWVESFDSTAFSGFGSYTIDPAAQIGNSDSGVFLVQYEQFNGDPAVCPSCFVSSGTFLQNFSVTATPEPSGFVMALMGAALVWLPSRRRRRSRK